MAEFILLTAQICDLNVHNLWFFGWEFEKRSSLTSSRSAMTFLCSENHNRFNISSRHFDIKWPTLNGIARQTLSNSWSVFFGGWLSDWWTRTTGSALIYHELTSAWHRYSSILSLISIAHFGEMRGCTFPAINSTHSLTVYIGVVWMM